MNMHKLPPPFKRIFQHKNPPPFNRNRFDLDFKSLHKKPPKFVREKPKKIENIVNSIEKTSENKEEHVEINEKHIGKSILIHKSPPIFKRNEFDEEKTYTDSKDIERTEEEKNFHLKPLIFSKKGLNQRQVSWSSKDSPHILLGNEDIRNENILDLQEETEKFHAEKKNTLPIFPNFHKRGESNRMKDDLPLRNEVSNSIESAIMQLQPEFVEFTTYKVSEDSKVYVPAEKNQESEENEYSDYSSSGVSSDSDKFIVPTLGNFNNSLPKSPQIQHKKPPPFKRNNKLETINSGYEDSPVSKSISLSNSSSSAISPKSFNSPINKNISNKNYNSSVPSLYKNISQNVDYLEEKIVFDSKNSYISGVSNFSHENLTKKSPALRTSFALDVSTYEKSKNVSPFLSENFAFKISTIPMKNINYLENNLNSQYIRFSNEFSLPLPQIIENNEFLYPSIKKSKRNFNSSVTIFSEKAEIPNSIRNKASLIPIPKEESKSKKYKVKKVLSSQEIDRMARILANDYQRQKGYSQYY